MVEIPEELLEDAEDSPRPPLGSPEPGAPDVDGAGGVSGPPQGVAPTARPSARAG